ncbi:MAG TPA: spore germination protein [Bacillota bacterium]|nr:spore germination protein [Bacillota bacterium]
MSIHLGEAEDWRGLATSCSVVDTMLQGIEDDLAWDGQGTLPTAVGPWVREVRRALGGSSDVVTRRFTAGRGRSQRPVAVVYLDGMVDARILDQDVITPLQQASGRPTAEACLAASSMARRGKAGDIISGILSGQAAIFLDGESATYLLDAQGFESRKPNEPTTERTILGSKEAFVEPLRVNITMIRRRIRTRALRIEQVSVGVMNPTPAVLVYVDTVANPALVTGVLARLHGIADLSVSTSAELAAYLTSGQLTPFPLGERTERPEVVSREILNGRVAVILDNDPFAILLPTTFWDLMQAHGDYTSSAWGATFSRSIRFFALLGAWAGPGLYAAVVMVHLDLVPHDLALTIVGGRRGVPVPAPLEYAFLILLFEILREVSIRIPKGLGTTIGVVGGIVLGQAVVQSGIASPPLIVVVSLVGLSLYTTPHYQLVASTRYVAITGLMVGSIFGLYGLLVWFVVLVLHLSSLTSFGTPYLAPASPVSRGLWLDGLFRAPFGRLQGPAPQYRPLRPGGPGGAP